MALLPLENAAWGFGSTCFVCEPGNQGGLRIPFLRAVAGDDARFVTG